MSEQRSISLYMHMGWPMNYPFSPKTWSMSEWNSWIDWVSELGVRELILWPAFEMLDSLDDPDQFTWVKKVSEIIRKCHANGLSIALGRSANAYADGSVFYSQRHQHTLNYCFPEEETYQVKIIDLLEKIFNELPSFDKWWVIDADPGNAMETEPKTLITCIKKQLELLPRETAVAYWMWGGWTSLRGQKDGWRNEKQSFWIDALNEFNQLERKKEVWYCWQGHLESLKNFEFEQKHFAYHFLEPEPSIPYPYHTDEKQSCLFTPDKTKGSLILNLQTPCLRNGTLENFIKYGSLKQREMQLLEKLWIWDREKYDEMYLKLKTLTQNESREIKKEALKEWQDYTGMPDVAKRGYLIERNS